MGHYIGRMIRKRMEEDNTETAQLLSANGVRSKVQGMRR